MTWNEQIKNARKTKGWSQQMTASQIGVSIRQYQYVESGKFLPNTIDMTTLCNKLECFITFPYKK